MKRKNKTQPAIVCCFEKHLFHMFKTVLLYIKKYMWIDHLSDLTVFLFFFIRQSYLFPFLAQPSNLYLTINCDPYTCIFTLHVHYALILTFLHVNVMFKHANSYRNNRIFPFLKLYFMFKQKSCTCVHYFNQFSLSYIKLRYWFVVKHCFRSKLLCSEYGKRCYYEYKTYN